MYVRRALELMQDIFKNVHAGCYYQYEGEEEESGILPAQLDLPYFYNALEVTKIIFLSFADSAGLGFVSKAGHCMFLLRGPGFWHPRFRNSTKSVVFPC
jgi:hypothetical protein